MQINEPTNLNRTLYYDILRIVATFAVILLHVSCSYWDTNTFNLDWNVRNIYDSLVRWCVPIFVMISGALFLNPQKQIFTKKLYTKNIVRIISAFFLWSFIYTIYQYVFINNQDITTLIVYFFNGPYHFWFLYMIVGLYITVPILRQITKDISTTKYFLIIAFIFTFVLPVLLTSISTALPVLTSKSIGISAILFKYFESLELYTIAGYSGYFILGYYLNYIFNPSKRQLKFIYSLGIISFILIATFTASISYIKGGLSEDFYDYLTLFVLFEAIAVYLFVKNFTPKLKLSLKAIKIITYLSNISFGIYCVHILVLSILSIIGFSSTRFNTIISIPIISVLTFIISSLIAICLHKIPFCRKYMM